MLGTTEGKVVAGEVGGLVLLVLRVVGEAVVGLQTDEAPEKALRHVAVSQWSLVVPHYRNLVVFYLVGASMSDLKLWKESTYPAVPAT